ncbi:uncharacterized protein LOC134219364 isoform X2 [Armigeres subalbatus]|uniref:uncharacterized protein LOC134219364 isoform X2 n=1 Tax=Armigeres subalbatus TaxID=124917 RepID=UPI002ED2E046
MLVRPDLSYPTEEKNSSEPHGHISADNQRNSSFVESPKEAHAGPTKSIATTAKRYSNLILSGENFNGQCTTKALSLDSINQRGLAFVGASKKDQILPGPSTPAEVSPRTFVGSPGIVSTATGSTAQSEIRYSDQQHFGKFLKQPGIYRKAIKTEVLYPIASGTAGRPTEDCILGKSSTPVEKQHPSKQVLKLQTAVRTPAPVQNLHSGGVKLSDVIPKHSIVGQDIVKISLDPQSFDSQCSSSLVDSGVSAQNQHHSEQQSEKPLKQRVTGQETESQVPFSTESRKSLAVGSSKEAWTSTDLLYPTQNDYFSPQHLEELLKQTIIGQHLMKRAAVGPLSADSQRELAQIVIDHHCNAGKRGKEEYLKDYAKSIVALFKYEKIETYFIPRAGGRRNPGGKLFNKLVNVRQKNAKRKLREEAHLHSKKIIPDPDDSDESKSNAIEWLEHNKLPWTTALDKWEHSYSLRKRQLKNKSFVDELFNRYQVYQDVHGYQAIDIDFRLMYGVTDGVKKWNNVLPKLVQYVDRPYKDDISKGILECLKAADTDINSKHCSILMLLNNVLKPTKVTRIFKPSVLAAQEEVILFAATDDLASATLDKFIDEYTKHGFQPVPKLIAIGENLTTLEGEFQFNSTDIFTNHNVVTSVR